jgi:hypothetical protein
MQIGCPAGALGAVSFDQKSTNRVTNRLAVGS